MIQTNQDLQQQLGPQQAIEKVRPQVEAIVEKARAYEVADQDSFEVAAKVVTEIATFKKQVKHIIDPFVKIASDALDAARRQRSSVIDPLDEAVAVYKKKTETWAIAEQNRRRQAEIELQQKRQQEEEERQLAEAIALEAAGETVEAEQAMEPVYVPPAPTKKEVTPTAPGLVLKDDWKAIVVDKMEFVKAVAAGKLPLAAVDVSESYLRAQAKSLKAEFKAPGVKCWNDQRMDRVGQR